MSEIEQLRQFPGFENVSDEEAREIIANLQELAETFFDSYKDENEQSKRVQPVRRESRAA